MADVYLSPRAARDFADIGDYTRDQWSEKQAETYLRQLLHVIRQVGEHPLLGQEISDVSTGYRRRRAGSHLIFYIVGPGGTVEVIRILHERSDALRHLGLD